MSDFCKVAFSDILNVSIRLLPAIFTFEQPFFGLYFLKYCRKINKVFFHSKE